MAPDLSSRERRVWIHVAHGRKHSAIAEDLGVCLTTVNNCRRRVTRKLGFAHLRYNESMAALVRAAASDLFFPA